LRHGLRARQTRRLIGGALLATGISFAVGFGLSSQIGIWGGFALSMVLTAIALIAAAVFGPRSIKM
jgi:hypothetical protein